MNYIDIHTHNKIGQNGVTKFINIFPWGNVNIDDNDTDIFTSGIHPWYINEIDVRENLRQIETWLKTGIIKCIGEDKLRKLQQSNVLVVGLGGVGAYAVEQLVRAGIGNITIIDGDTVHPTNRNRQLIAFVSTEGQRKADIVAERLKDINPALNLTIINEFIKYDRIPEMLEQPYDFVIDAIDTLNPKVSLIVEACKRQYPLISSMGAGGKVDPSMIKIADISETYNCKLSRMVRKRLSKYKIKKGFTAVFSPEPVNKDHVIEVLGEQNKKTTVGTISYMPAMFGLNVASHVIRKLAEV